MTSSLGLTIQSDFNNSVSTSSEQASSVTAGEGSSLINGESVSEAASSNLSSHSVQMRMVK